MGLRALLFTRKEKEMEMKEMKGIIEKRKGFRFLKGGGGRKWEKERWNSKRLEKGKL